MNANEKVMANPLFLLLIVLTIIVHSSSIVATEENLTTIMFAGHLYPSEDATIDFFRDMGVSKPSLIILGGDVIEGYVPPRRNDDSTRAKVEGQWNQFDLWRENVSSPIVYVAGNHEIEPLDQQWKKEIFINERNPLVMVTSVGNAQIFILDSMSNADERRNRYIDTKQIDLINNINKSPGTHYLFFIHDSLWFMPESQWGAVEEKLDELGAYVFAGGGDALSYIKKGNITYTVVGFSQFNGIRDRPLLYPYVEIQVSEETKIRPHVVGYYDITSSRTLFYDPTKKFEGRSQREIGAYILKVWGNRFTKYVHRHPLRIAALVTTLAFLGGVPSLFILKWMRKRKQLRR